MTTPVSPSPNAVLCSFIHIKVNLLPKSDQLQTQTQFNQDHVTDPPCLANFVMKYFYLTMG